MSSDRRDFDCLVVGAGLSGLTAAASLGRSGHSVLVLERSNELGGRARTDDRDGWLFNRGGHALYKDGLGREILNGLGVEPDGEEPTLQNAQFSLNGEATSLPLGPAAIARSKALSVRGKVQFAGLMTALPKLDPEDFAAISVDEWLSDYRSDVAAVVKAIVRLSTYAADSGLLSAGAAIAQLQIAGGGVLYLHGGWARMVAQLAEVAMSSGAQIQTSAEVTEIQGLDEGFSTEIAGEMVFARSVVISAGGPTLTARLLGLDGDFFAHAGPAPRAAVLDMSLSSMPSRYRFVLGLDECTYFSVHSPPAQMVPEGKANAVAMYYLGADDDRPAEHYHAALVAQAELAGVVDPVATRFMRAMTVAHGIPLASQGGLKGRPSVHVEQIPGAFIAGDWVGDRAMLADAAIASGDTAARQVAAFVGEHAILEV